MDEHRQHVSCYRASNPSKMMTAKQRVSFAKEMTELPVGESRVYRLTHTYDLTPGRAAYVRTSILAEALELLVAFIQFECADLDESYAMDQLEVATVLSNFYGVEYLGECDPGGESQEIDLYINWERHCGSDVQSVDMFQRPELKACLYKILDSHKPDQCPQCHSDQISADDELFAHWICKACGHAWPD